METQPAASRCAAGDSGSPAAIVERRIAARLAALRAASGWPLEELAGRSGISRATLSRLERGELSPTAAMLSALCAVYGWTLSRLMADAETGSPSLVRSADQTVWRDPATHYVRRVISPPHSSLRGEMVEVELPPHAVVSYGAAPVAGLEHHLVMMAGVLEIDVEGGHFRLERGDTLRYVLNGASRFECKSKRAARYVIAMVHP